MLTRLAHALAHHPRRAAVTAMVVLLLLAVPLLTMAPEGTASQEPGGPAFDARDLVATRLAPDVATEFALMEAVDGDLLDPGDLRELHGRLDRLRTEPGTAGLLATSFDRALGRPVEGTLAITDVLDELLAPLGGLTDAPDAAVTEATDGLITELGPSAFGLATGTEVDADGRWSAPALALALSLDNEPLGGGTGGATLGGDTTDRERSLRGIRDVLRGGAPGDAVTRDEAGPLIAHAVAADVNLTSEEQGQAAGPFIGITVLLTLLLVGLVFRSAWTVAVVGTGVAGLMIWLLGWSNLLGLEQDQILATIVPIALVSFGIDFAFHAIGRVEEERAAGRPPRGALTVGLAGVGGALLLALGSDSAAFLANTVSGIESIVQFGFAASIGLLGAFLLLGVVAPVVLTGIRDHVGPQPTGRRATAVHVAAGLAAAGVAMASVLMTVYVAPVVGVGLFVALALLGVALPTWLVGRRAAAGSADVAVTGPGHDTEVAQPTGAFQPDGLPTAHASAAEPGRVARLIGAGVAWVSRRGAIVLPAAALVTVVAAAGAVQVEARFDVEDFFDADTDFVVGLDALDRFVGDTGGEATQLVVTGDLTDPALLGRLGEEVAVLRTVNGDVFATDADGATRVDGGVVDLVQLGTVPAVAGSVERATGVEVVDADGDGLPDTREGIAAVLDVAADGGLVADGVVVVGPEAVSGIVDRNTEAGDATVVTLELPGSREVTAIARATELLEPRVDTLRADLQALDPSATVELTGAPIVRQLSLDAVTRALLLSLPIAVLACLLVAALALRSLRTALVAVVPILLVVPWLYGTMWAAGYAVNLVTGTIGAISIGIGIDFAIHLVARYREELDRLGDRDGAMRATGEGTGVALVASAVSSVLGFAVLAFAPMPMFAAFGLLTAVMIAMALTATLLVLPPLLRLTSRDRPTMAASAPAGPAPAGEASLATT